MNGENTPEKPASPGRMEAVVRRLFEMLDKADDLLSTGDVLLDGWPGAREWHKEYESLSVDANIPHGDVIIDAVIKSNALVGAEKTASGFIFVWSATAAEQIEAAMNDAGWIVLPNAKEHPTT